MSFYGTFLRRNFEPVILSVQVLVDLAVVLLACWLGYGVGVWAGAIKDDPLGLNGQLYRQLSALIAAVCLVTFHTFGMYSPTKSLLNMQEFKAVAKSTVVAFLVFLTLIVYLHSTRQDPVGRSTVRS
jgi:FlaA1/EpsC-like NDP-sugar epimerase